MLKSNNKSFHNRFNKNHFNKSFNNHYSNYCYYSKYY